MPENERELQTKLQQYQRAIEQEYTESLKSKPGEELQLTQDFFKSHMSLFAAQIVHLAEHADSETVRLNASKLGLSVAMDDARADGDPIAQLLRELTKSKPKKANAGS